MDNKLNNELNMNRESRRKLSKAVNKYDAVVKRALEAEGLTIQEVKEELVEWLKIQGQMMKEKNQTKSPQ